MVGDESRWRDGVEPQVCRREGGRAGVPREATRRWRPWDASLGSMDVGRRFEGPCGCAVVLTAQVFPASSSWCFATASCPKLVAAMADHHWRRPVPVGTAGPVLVPSPVS